MQANPRKTDSVRRLGKLDIENLRQAVLDLPEAVWERENAAKPNRFDVFDITRHIVFRFVHDVKDWRSSYDLPIWQEWRDIVQPVLDQAVAPYGYARGVFPRVMLARMKAVSMIHPHRDTGVAAKWPHKVHVPILTNRRVIFTLDDQTHHFPEGEAVELNNLGVHAVRNDGPSDRIHLVFEYYDADQEVPAAA